jgi:excisionase family DNA binding protein
MVRLVVDTSEVYETREAAQVLGIGYATLFRWIKRGRLIPWKFGRRTYIPRSEIERLKKGQNENTQDALG